MVKEFNITSNVKQFSKSLNNLGKKQLPFALANAMNDVMFKDVRPKIVNETFPKAFKTRAKNMARGVLRIKKARKNKLVAEFSDVMGRTYLEQQQQLGKTKTPRGKFIAVPVFKPGRRVSKSKRKNEHSPAALLRDRSRFFFGRAGRGVVGDGGRDEGGSGVLGIWERKKNGKLRMWYRMILRAEYDPILDFNKDASFVAVKNFPKRFDKQFQRAIKTAK